MRDDICHIKKIEMRSIRMVMPAICFNIPFYQSHNDSFIRMASLGISCSRESEEGSFSKIIGTIGGIRMPRMGYSSITFRANFFCSINM